MQDKIYDVVIIGAGPAGLAAAIYGCRAGLSLVVIDENPIHGGQVLSTNVIDNYPGLPGILGVELGDSLGLHALGLGTHFITGRVTEILPQEPGFIIRIFGQAESIAASAVILATGATPAILGVPGETELAGAGVSYCATCDGAFMAGAEVAVVGGGDTAVSDAIYLARICRRVHLIHRRGTFRAAAALVTEMSQIDNIVTHMDTVVEAIVGTVSVQGVRVKNVKTDCQETLPLEGVFIAVGTAPQTALVRELARCDEAGFVIAGEDCVTSLPGLYAAGDIRKKPLRQIVTAVADGANAVASLMQ